MTTEQKPSSESDAINFRATRPGPDEFAPYHSRYIDRVPDGDICATLESQLTGLLGFLETISEQQSLHRYEPGKWSIREVLTHINDSERVFCFRAFWFARGFDSPLPGYDQDIGVRGAGGDERPLAAHAAEFKSLRQATLDLFHDLPAAAWQRHGIASDNPVTVRALAWIIAGHVMHHVAILEERYLGRSS